jgi:hypothetical protein
MRGVLAGLDNALSEEGDDEQFPLLRGPSLSLSSGSVRLPSPFDASKCSSTEATETY